MGENDAGRKSGVEEKMGSVAEAPKGGGDMSQYTIASVSCGKDSLVIPYEYIRRGLRLDEVIMYDTGMEF